MDVQRSPEVKKKKKQRQIAGLAAIALALSGMTYFVWTLEPALLEVDAASVYSEKVQEGAFIRSVNGPGTLVPEEIRWITAETAGQVEKVLIDPGAEVTPDSVILLLSNPELDQDVADAEVAWRSAQSEYTKLRVRLAGELLSQEADLAQLDADSKSAQLKAAANSKLNREGLVADLEVQQSDLTAEHRTVRYQKAKERMEMAHESHQAELAAQNQQVDQKKAIYELRRRQLADLQVRAGIFGILQEVPVDEGQRLTPGTFLARVAQPDVLKAELRIAETQANDIVIGQHAEIDTRHGKIPGHVVRIDPAVNQGSVLVDIKLDVKELPKVARIDLSVDGVIELERIDHAVYVRRPAYSQANSSIGLFKIKGDNTAHRTTVKTGRLSVQFMEILEGLKVGDEVILSDSSQWDEHDAIRLN